jgi:hypothetical protein
MPILRLIVGAAMIHSAALAPAIAQVPGLLPPPDLQNRIPEALPPPPKPLAVPLGERAPQPGVYQPPKLRTQSDRTVDCVQQGSEAGLHGGKLDTYTRRCANAN